MALYTEQLLQHGNIKKFVKVFVSRQNICCPICNEYVDGRVDEDGDVVELGCDCDIDNYIETHEHDDQVEQLEDEIVDLKKEIEDLERQLRDAQ